MPESPLEVVEAKLAPGARGFTTTRSGGVSEGSFARLNLGEKCGDDPDRIAENRRRLSELLPSAPKWLDQVHGTRVIHLDDWRPGIAADAAWTDRPGQVAAILSADCLPVLLAASGPGVVAAVHAGWRGLAAGVLENTLHALPVPPGHLVAWIGPGISGEDYEVGPEVREAFVAGRPRRASCFRPSGTGRWHADLKAIAAAILAEAGVRSVIDSGLCTFSDPDRFFSWRRNSSGGRMASVVWLDES